MKLARICRGIPNFVDIFGGLKSRLGRSPCSIENSEYPPWGFARSKKRDDI